MLERSDQLITSAMSVGEILVKPQERQDHNLCRQYEEAITSTALVLPFDLNAARRFSTLRIDRSLRAPEAIQLACAATAGIDLFITNDNRLSGLRVDGIQFIVSLDRSPLLTYRKMLSSSDFVGCGKLWSFEGYGLQPVRKYLYSGPALDTEGSSPLFHLGQRIDGILNPA